MRGHRLVIGIACALPFAGEQEDFPLEARRRGITALLVPAQDLPVQVLRPRVSLVHRHLVAALIVVGQSDVDLARARMHRHPFRAIHGRGAEPVGRGACVEQYLGLAGEAVFRRQPILPVNQGQPLAAAVGIEACDIERALVEQLAVLLICAGHVATGGHELVDVLAARVVAGIEGHAPILAQRQHRTFAAVPAHGGSLDRLRLRVEGIDFHHPAEAVRLVDMAAVGSTGIGCGIEAFIGAFPAIEFAAFATRNAVAGVGGS